MARVLTDREIRRVEQWARSTQIAKMLSFFERLPREIRVARRVLLGSNNGCEIYFEGFAVTSMLIRTIANLDEPFSANCFLEKNLTAEKRKGIASRPLASVYKELGKNFGKICLLAHLGDCLGEIVRAHTVQKSVFKAHTKDGHVYNFDPLRGPLDTENRSLPKLIGINNATTFTGFCQRHDSQIFLPIENHSYLGTPEQKFLYHYRSFMHAYYDRVFKFKIIENAVNNDLF